MRVTTIAFSADRGMTVLDLVGAYDLLTRLDRMDYRPIWRRSIRAPGSRIDAL